MTRCAVFGMGSWGTAFSVVLAEAGCDVVMWGRRPEQADAINARHENEEYLPGIALPVGIEATTDPAKAAEGAEFVVLAVPSQTLRGNLTAWAPMLSDDAILVSLMKGVELGTANRMSEVIREVAGVPEGRIAVVSGPNLAMEIAQRQPAASVVACTDEEVARRLQEACHTSYFRPYTNTDVVGCELGGAVKNVIALAVGMADGMGMGDNTKATLITRGLAETARLGAAMGADAHTFAGLAGLGDLVATCTSPLSRNRTFGEKIGRGTPIEEAVRDSRQIAEGFKSCESVQMLARRYGVEMPITDVVVSIMHGGKPPTVGMALLSRSAKPER
ncbi:NAD(P)H-dependent glycerol-3-phosphate dehydrogenase [Embleya hyalina]|uniref:Glycerol-3-phosphate dehydrogenase [NAD(P)+] n=1 Tax=Embleya hyalina TaxID=516124 RepID=A0A401Z306_9ACTN|nr:NAD(P)H-dependent glycerol-3-phosphate dehydrogenase [Embleya hyalina]GCE01148.1 glycerol-3-phosphate dehydrogenase [NAD(P)+] [Embleya hyalina]